MRVSISKTTSGERFVSRPSIIDRMYAIQEAEDLKSWSEITDYIQGTGQKISLLLQIRCYRIRSTEFR